MIAAVLAYSLAELAMQPAAAQQAAKPSGAASADLDPNHAEKMARGLEVFRGQVRSTLKEHCVKCHGGQRIESEFDLTDRDRLLKGGALGAAIVPGKSAESLLYRLVAHQDEPHMPHEADKLPVAAIEQIAAWIDLGAPYDEPLVPREAAASNWTERVLPAEARRHWAFQPLAAPEPPTAALTTEQAVWCRGPIDTFIAAGLSKAGQGPNPPANKQQLIRRLYFDLVGLPPPPEEVAAFVRDESPGAYESLVDRLLASPHYGERWARHWLDVARFGESHGFEHDYDRPSAYPYRDFVIQALNRDLPFDTFVRWQIAGDELAPNENLALMATGYLAAGVHSTQITKNEVEKHRYDELDDMLATVGTSMLGLTIGCARCHDHKFDPIPQRDYYRLLSAFTTTVRSEIELNADPAAYAAARAKYDAEHAPYIAAREKWEAEQLPARLAAWEAERRAAGEIAPDKLALPAAPWRIAELVETKSAGGATFKPLDDGSVLAEGKNAASDTYELVVRTPSTEIRYLRIEALADPSLAKGGPGRAENGNFALSEIAVTAEPADTSAAPADVKLVGPHATFEQAGLPAAATLDGDAKSGWAIDPQFGRDQAIAYRFETPLAHSSGWLLTIKLSFEVNTGHAIGRPRVSVSNSAESPDPAANSLSTAVAAALVITAGERSSDQVAVLNKWYRTQDADWQSLDRAEREHAATAPKPNMFKCLISSEGLPALRLHTQGGDFLEETCFLRRGDPNLKDGVASLGYLQVLNTASDGDQHWPAQPPAGARTSFRRAALANWLTDTECGAGDLLARVIVNRLWQHHLGRGIVATPSDFGTRGAAPSHPELLDWLASRLIADGWHLKPLHKLIVTSATYQQSSAASDSQLAADPDNRLFGRQTRRRLEAEVIRDALLATAGALDEAMFGPGTLDSTSRRRSIYFTVKRSQLMPMMQVFDAPDALQGLGERQSTTIAPQALYLLNNPQARDLARLFAQRVADGTELSVATGGNESSTDRVDWPPLVRRAYLAALGREPAADELESATAFLDAQAARHQADGDADARRLALVDFCQALLCLNEFVYVE
ncbi:MAG: PSD1 and planctomycete cytochrome C domain-containing protein [Pirellulales bacterium]|nr:PSD1 and planctomycete cytochrome C domain-containing protein [Pirellulales bacterium]